MPEWQRKCRKHCCETRRVTDVRSPYQKTMYACFIGYIVQAVVNNFVPLLFVTFQKTYQISLSKITFLITIKAIPHKLYSVFP